MKRILFFSLMCSAVTLYSMQGMDDYILQTITYCDAREANKQPADKKQMHDDWSSNMPELRERAITNSQLEKDLFAKESENSKTNQELQKILEESKQLKAEIAATSAEITKNNAALKKLESKAKLYTYLIGSEVFAIGSLLSLICSNYYECGSPCIKTGVALSAIAGTSAVVGIKKWLKLKHQ